MATENFKTFSMTVTVEGGGEVRMRRRGSVIPMASEYQLTMKHTEFTPERSIESYGLLDLYSHHAFLTVLHTPRIYDAFAVFLRSEHSSENLTFWSRCARYIRLNREISQTVTTIDNDHLQEGAIEEVNVAHRFKMEGISKAKSVILAMEETLETYRDLQKEVEMLMWRDSYPRFLKHHLAYNASKSLEWSPTRMYTFKGLGECFCLTDPGKPDNPITLCSDAFVQVTGYPVSQIINHNCRFLQGSLSDPATVNRIRQAIKDGRESTEVFLNHRHDGTPFWNLLLVAPLKNYDGEIVHFFGAQVDVSSLFHKHNDLSAILSRDFSLADTPPATAEGSRKSFFRRVSEKTKTSLRLNRSLSTTQLSSGLEEEVVRDNINTIGEQVDVFRSAYAKYILVSPDSGRIQFCSEAARALFPMADLPLNSHLIFPLLTQTFSNIDSRSLKSLQRAFNNSQPTSIRLTTSPPTTPTAEDAFNAEAFDADSRSRQSSTATNSTEGSLVRNRTGNSAPIVAVHLTPLKDAAGAAGMYVFVLATGI